MDVQFCRWSALLLILSGRVVIGLEEIFSGHIPSEPGDPVYRQAGEEFHTLHSANLAPPASWAYPQPTAFQSELDSSWDFRIDESAPLFGSHYDPTNLNIHLESTFPNGPTQLDDERPLASSSSHLSPSNMQLSQGLGLHTTQTASSSYNTPPASHGPSVFQSLMNQDKNLFDQHFVEGMWKLQPEDFDKEYFRDRDDQHPAPSIEPNYPSPKKARKSNGKHTEASFGNNLLAKKRRILNLADFASESSIFPRDEKVLGHSFGYKIVEFEPTSIDGQIVVEALDRLGVKKGMKFFKLSKTDRKMFCLDPRSENGINEFCDFFFKINDSRFVSNLRVESEGAVTTPRNLRQNLNVLFINAHDETDNIKKNPSYSRILTYKQMVLRKYDTWITNFQAESDEVYRSRTSSGEQREYSHKKRKIVTLLPAYLIYVDMISTMIPIRDLDKEGKLLESQQKEAVHSFFQLCQSLLFEESEISNLKDDHKIDLMNQVIKTFTKKNFAHKRTGASLVWNLLVYWMMSSRKDLYFTRDLGAIHLHNFQRFFNALVHDWVSSFKHTGFELSEVTSD